jgi:hypothetical protein
MSNQEKLSNSYPESLQNPENSKTKVSEGVSLYLKRALTEQSNTDVQRCPFVNEAWGSVLPRFTKDLGVRLEKVRSKDDLSNLITPIVTRGVELVSGGTVSSQDLIGDERRGLERGGTWPDAPGATFWDPREQRNEQLIVKEIVSDVLQINTDASEEHVGRVITMSLPAIISWADLRDDLTPKAEIIETVRRLLESEKTGSIDIVSFGCEPYQYRHEPNTTTGHFRMSEFGSENLLRRDAIHGSFRAIRRIIEPVSLSGVDVGYSFFTSFGNSWELIQRQVMPDTINYYRVNRSSEEMLDTLSNWKQIIETIGTQEFTGSNLRLSMQAMESQVVLPALKELARVLSDCGMSMPDDIAHFYYNSEQWFAGHVHELNLIEVINNHPDPRLLVNFLINENEWSQKHPDAYESEAQRVAQSSLLSFFEQHQYQRINEIINSADVAMGVEIDEELILLIRERSRSKGEIQSPLIWGRPPRYTNDGMPGGVGHRQPWFYE